MREAGGTGNEKWPKGWGQLQQTVTKQKEKLIVAPNLNFYVKSCDVQTMQSV